LATATGTPNARTIEPPTCVGDGAFHVAKGYAAAPFALGLSNPTSIAFGPDGRLYVAELRGTILALEDADGDYVAERQWVYARDFASPLGIAFRGEELYVSSHNRITFLRDRDGDGLAEQAEVIIPDLRATGQHQNNGLAFGPDGKLYITHGSSTNDKPPSNPYDATILQANPDGTGLRVFATGLRNPYDLAFDRQGRLFATDNGIDSDAEPFIPDELNLIEDGGFYGFPWISGLPTAANQAERPSRAPVALLPAHASADGLAFYTADPASPLYDDLFIAYWGPTQDPEYKCSPNTSRLVHVRFDERLVAAVNDFAFGFQHALDVTIGPDGAIYVADFGAGAVYRIAPVLASR
jgi:putative membrane-bound dehydrogenase-like protein